MTLTPPNIFLSTNSTSADISQLGVNLLTIAIAVASSSAAVVVGEYVRNLLKTRSRGKQIKSFVISYLTRILEGLPNVISFYQFFSMFPSWTEDQMPLMPTLTKSARLLDTSIYDTRIRDNLLYLDAELADDVSRIDQLIRLVNDYVESNLTIINGSKAESLSKWFKQNSKKFAVAQDILTMITNTTDQFRTALLKHKKKTGIDWLPLLKKSEELSTILGIPKSALSSS